MQTLVLLSLAQMGKFFSHFGMRTLLVLYLIEHFAYTDGVAFGINALFCGLCELSAIFGGVVADRYLGLKRATLLGAVVLTVGYISFLFPHALFISMGLIIAGSGLFTGNITAILGESYQENDPERKKGFTFFYMMQNLGALLATLLCGAISVYFGFQWAFAFASLGMLFGNLLLVQYHGNLPPSEKKAVIFPTCVTLLLLAVVGSIAVASEHVLLLFLPWITAALLIFFVVQLKMPKLFFYLGAIVLFFAVEDQIASSLLLFAERETTRTLLGYTLPSSFIMIMNPIVIFLFGAVIARKAFSLSAPFFITASSFGFFAAFCLFHVNCSIFGVMALVSIISIAELMIGPLVMSRTSEIATKGSSGLIMSMIPLAFSLSYQCSGILSQVIASQTHSLGFGLVAVLMLVGGLLLMRKERILA